MQALVLKSISDPLTLETGPVPSPTIASAVVKILAVSVISYAREVFNGTRAYPFPKPVIPGSSAVGRIAVVPADATKLKQGI